MKNRRRKNETKIFEMKTKFQWIGNFGDFGVRFSKSCSFVSSLFETKQKPRGG